jgi:hypothetical protein
MLKLNRLAALLNRDFVNEVGCRVWHDTISISMQISEVAKPRTPQQVRVDQLRTQLDAARRAAKTARLAQQQVKLNQQRQKLNQMS